MSGDPSPVLLPLGTVLGPAKFQAPHGLPTSPQAESGRGDTLTFFPSKMALAEMQALALSSCVAIS